MNTKLKIFLSTITAVGVLSGSLFAQSVQLQVRSAGFADSAGDIIPPGSLYAIVVDTDGSGFANGLWGPSDFTRNSLLALEDGTLTSNAISQFGTSETGGPPLFLEGTINQITIDHADGVGAAATGNQWGVIWFPGVLNDVDIGEGTSYGFFTNANLTIPSAGSAVNYFEFIGNDIKTADYTIVPEPSTYAAIFGFGVLLFVFLRRRFKK